MRKKFLRILGTALAMALIVGMLPVIPAFAAGTLGVPSPASGTSGQVVYLSGTGFPVGTITIYFNSSYTTSGAYTYGGGSTATGNFTSIPFSVPTVGRGTYYVWVTVGSETSAARTFTVIPGMTLSTITGNVGDQITITGTGFTASNSVTIYLDSVIQLTTTANAYGMFSTSFTIPRGTQGYHTFAAYDVASFLQATTMFTILPKLTVSPTSGPVKTALTLTGTGYAANSGTTIYFDDASVASTSSDAFGGFTITNFAIPATTSGSHVIRAQDAVGNFQTATISVTSGITITPATGPVGTQVTVTGNGFRASETISLTLDNTAIGSGGITSDSLGRFTATVSIPAIGAGERTLRAADSINNSTASFKVTSSVALSPNSGYVGTRITLNGNGFLANSAITLTFDNTPVGTASTNSLGAFTSTFEAPARQAGNYKIRVSDGLNTQEVNFNVTTSATITPTSASSPGYVGATVTVSGVGFKAGATLTVTYGGKQVATGAVGADSNFSVIFKAPASRSGAHTIIVSDGTITLPLSYYMEGVAPPVPTLLEPQTGKRYKAQGKYTWNPVSDPSGLTYEFQIATSVGFSPGTIVVEKTGLTTPEYSLLKGETLKATKKDAPYYWRVRAVDNAGNEGNWSNIWTFAVGSVLPLWALWTMIGLGALIVLLFAFWLGRRSGNRPVATRIQE